MTLTSTEINGRCPSVFDCTLNTSVYLSQTCGGLHDIEMSDVTCVL